MGAQLALVIHTAGETAAVMQSRYVAGSTAGAASQGARNRHRLVRDAMALLESLMGGARRGLVRVSVGDVFASQTITCDRAAAVDDTDTVTIGGTTLSLKAAPANESQFAKGASDATMAANLAAVINAHSTLREAVSASALAAVVTVKCVYPGRIGNMIVLTEVGNGMTLGAAALAGGTGNDPVTHEFGYSG